MEATVDIKKMLVPEICSSRIVSPCREESGDDELSVLPRHTKVIVTGNNRTKSVLVGLQGVVKKAVGLGGWHWLVLKNGVEVKLQRNALMVLEPPTGNEVDDDDHELDNSYSSSDMGEKDNDFCKPLVLGPLYLQYLAFCQFSEILFYIEIKSVFHYCAASGLQYPGLQYARRSKPRVRLPKQCLSSAKSVGRNNLKVQSNIHKPQPRLDLGKLGMSSLWRYCKHYNLVSFVYFSRLLTPGHSKEHLVNIVQRHFLSQRLDETQVILEFINAAKRLKMSDEE
ncbi:hypothetical protein IFM89_022733 [Coptis chinensis]|uniref:Histone deacetylase complex subunit SAP30 Sin3 binding domain-containing protein n=1 Tax=Coptis chinensis TaxID=261450 RepID=A0A835IEV5_9MAGN|nr:hypothetical protein IFM89_022733 [Coptis chinensis]